MSRSRWVVATVMLIAAGTYIAMRGYGVSNLPSKDRGQGGPDPVPVHVATVEKSTFRRFLTGLGAVQPLNTVTVNARVDGQIEKVAFEEGQMVSAGDLLVQIDAAPFKATLEQAIAKRAQDQSSLVNAQQDLQRAIILTGQGNDTQQVLDQRTAQVARLSASVQTDDAAIEAARVQLNYTTIRSPLTGRIGFRLIDAGNIVHAGDRYGMLTIMQLQPISIIFTLPEQQLSAVSEAMKTGSLEVTALSSDGKRELSTGTLTLIDNQVNTGSGTIRLRAAFANPDNALWPGLSVMARLLVATLRDVVVVPDTAVQRGPSGLFAYVVTKEGKAERRTVKIGAVEDGNALVEQGLMPGEQLVVSGHSRVQPGVSLQIVQGADVTSASTRE
jgi:membrane fusion protein, multidrug efflux system